ncbi:MAG TPA: hypothetical protein VGK24_09675, partial [Candidatus Angelobacter sp.]
VYASGCTGLSKLDAPNAKSVYARGCTGLSKLDAPNADYVYASDCTGLSLDDINAPIIAKTKTFIEADLVPLLKAGGRFDEVMKPEHWTCNDWNNCPMAAAFGVDGLEGIPSEWREKARFFIARFDSGLIRREMVQETN